MIIIGDVASPNHVLSDRFGGVLNENAHIFRDKSVICNLEGLICDDMTTDTGTPVLFSHSRLIEVLNRESNLVVSLANNHTLDLPKCFEDTRKLLRDNGIPFAGAGTSEKDASNPVIFYDGDQKVILFNYCWSFLLYNQNNPDSGVYVAVIEEMQLIDQIKKYSESQPDAAIVVYFHWSIDLELFPYPMYRTFSKALIDAGADLIAGCHSHCVQGGEKYKDGYIVYGLGNFYIPWHEYAGGSLDFPDFSKISMALEWDVKDKKTYCHWFEYQENDKTLRFVETESFEESVRLKQFTPYMNMPDQDYVKYFKKNRRKSFLIPVYKDHTKLLKNRFFTFILKTRAKIARKLAETNLIKWQS